MPRQRQSLNSDNTLKFKCAFSDIYHSKDKLIKQAAWFLSLSPTVICKYFQHSCFLFSLKANLVHRLWKHVECRTTAGGFSCLMFMQTCVRVHYFLTVLTNKISAAVSWKVCQIGRSHLQRAICWGLALHNLSDPLLWHMFGGSEARDEPRDEEGSERTRRLSK